MTFNSGDFSSTVKIMRYRDGSSIKQIAAEIGVCRDVLRNWSNGVQPKNADTRSRVASLIRRVCSDNEALAVIKTAEEISDWKDLVLGLLNELGINQTDLCFRLGIDKYDPAVSQWINGNCPPNVNAKFRLVRILQQEGLNSNELIARGIQVRNSLNLPDRSIATTSAIPRSKLHESLFVYTGRKPSITSAVLFPKEIKHKSVQLIFDKGSLIVFYKNNTRSQPEPLVLPLQIKVNETLLVGIGLYLGEGTRTMRQVKISNSEPEIIRKARKFFSHIGLKNPAHFGAWLQIHELSKVKPTAAKKHWERIMGRSINNIWIKPKRGKKIVEVEQYGTLHLEYNGILARYLINGLLDVAEELAFSIPNGVKYLLQGLYAAEGYVGCHPAGSLRTIKFTAMRAEDRRLMVKLLSCPGVSYAEDVEKGDIRVHGYENLKKLVEIDIFKYHPFRKARITRGFEKLRNSHIPGLNKKMVLAVLNNGVQYRTSEIQRLTGLRYKNTSKHLRELYKLGKISTSTGSGSRESKWWVK